MLKSDGPSRSATSRAPFERLVEPEDVTQRHGRVIRHDVVASPHLASDVDGELPRRSSASSYRPIPDRISPSIPAPRRTNSALCGSDAPHGGRGPRQLQRSRVVAQSSRSCRRACGTARPAPADACPAPTSRALAPAISIARSRSPSSPRIERAPPHVPSAGASRSFAPISRGQRRWRAAPTRSSPPLVRSRTSTAPVPGSPPPGLGPRAPGSARPALCRPWRTPRAGRGTRRDGDGSGADQHRSPRGRAHASRSHTSRRWPSRGASAITGREEVLDRPGRLASFAPVVRQDPCELRRIGDRRLDHPRRRRRAARAGGRAGAWRTRRRGSARA